MKKIGVLLCGCGHRDGSEIHEATLTMLLIEEAGAECVCFAPRLPQTKVRDHMTGVDTKETRDMLTESARIARGKIRDIKEVGAGDFDALIIPGGQGAALNLSSFLAEGSKCSVLPDVERIVSETYKAKKPIGAICIAPGTLSKVMEKLGVRAELTLGTDAEFLSKIEEMGQTPKVCAVTDCVVDGKNKIVTTPAYMLAKNMVEVKRGIEKLVKTVVEMA